MAALAPDAPRVSHRQSLSARLWLLTILAVLITEVVIFLPYVAHERRTWLIGRVEDASIAMLAASGDTIAPPRRGELLALLGAAALRVSSDGTNLVVGDASARPELHVDLRQEDRVTGLQRAIVALFSQEDRLMAVTAQSPFLQNTTLELLLHERGLSEALRQFARDFAGLALAIAAVTGALVYFAVLLLLVRPMRRITGSIAAFRADPEGTPPLDPDEVSVLSADEIAIAGRELAAMQRDLRAALWRNARLAALGTVVAKVSHDLRGILTPALLTAERLQLNADARVQRAGETLVQAVDRATELVRRTLDYAREGPPSLALAPIELTDVVNEAAESLRPPGTALHVENTVERSILVNADKAQLFRVFTNLLRNAAEAGAGVVRVCTQQQSPTVVVDVADDGPGLPEPVQAELFRPFASMRRGGTGLGLAIARDLMVAHGGSIELVATGETGTVFRLTLRAAEAQPAPARREVAPDEEKRASDSIVS